MRKYTLLTGLLFSTITFLFAQAPNQGILLLGNDTQVDGVIDINAFINSAIVTTDDERQLTYHASMIDEIVTVDDCDRERTYRSYDYRSNSFFDRMEKKLFQVVNAGSITLLRRVFEYDIFDADDEYTIEEWYYLEEGKVKRIRNFRRQVLPLMAEYTEEMKEFRRLNRLRNLNDDLSMFLMVSYYNRLQSLSQQSLLSQR